jgi:hypothetical protein
MTWGKMKNRISESQCLCGPEIPRVYIVEMEAIPSATGESPAADGIFFVIAY